MLGRAARSTSDAPESLETAEQAEPLRHARHRGSSGVLKGFQALRNPDFRLLWIGLLFSQGAMQINLVARGWLAYHVSGSGAALGLVALASGVPMGLFSIVGGAIADRHQKRRILMIVHSALALAALATAVLVHLDIVVVWHLAAVGFLQGAVFAFSIPARQALIPLLVRDEDMANAVAMNSTGLNMTRVLAPTLAGGLLAWEPAISFDVIAVLYIVSVFMLFRLPKDAPGVQRQSAARSVVEGFQYVWGERTVRTLLLLAFVPVLLGLPFQQFLPVFQEDVLHVSRGWLGLMFTAAGVGSLAGSLGVAYLSTSRRAGLYQLLAGLGFGVSLVLFGLSRSFPLSLAMLALVGLASQGFFVMNNVLLMNQTEPRYYGRMMSIYMITFALMPVGVLPMGYFIDLVGAPLTQAGAGALLAVFIGLFVAGELRPKRAAAPEAVAREPGTHEADAAS